MTEYFNIKYPCGCKLPTVVIMFEGKEMFLPIKFEICTTHKKEYEDKRWR